ncbi:MAG: hypothetical protein Q8N37_02435 [bacterium]|nr:hypothetical protein [bacterium]
MANKGDFVQQANAKRGKQINDAVILKTEKGESTETTIGVNLNGGTNQMIVVL